MAGVRDASEAEMKNGGRTVDEILEDMREDEARNPGPVKKFLKMSGQKAMMTAKANVKSAVRQYFGMMAEAAVESGVEDTEMDGLLAEAFDGLVGDMTDEVADVTVNGMTPEEKMKADELQKGNTEEKSVKPTYAPDEKDNIRIALAETEARKEGKTTKKLQYTDDQMTMMSPDGVTMAGKSGLVSVDQMKNMGLDVTEVVKNVGKSFGVTPAALMEVKNVPKVKVLPELAPQADFGLEQSGVVTSERDMANLGDDEIFTKQAQDKASVFKEVANVTVGVGQQALSNAELTAARGKEAYDSLNIEAIDRNREAMEAENDGFIKF